MTTHSQGTRRRPLFDPPIVKRAVRDAVRKLDPRHQLRNPVMFVVMVGSVFTTIIFARELMGGIAGWGFTLQLALWLWFTVLFANFAEAMAEGRGKAQADSLRKSRTQTTARRLTGTSRDGKFEQRGAVSVDAEALRRGDVVLCLPGDMIPGDGDVVEGVASVDESAITGESAPVIRESGGDRSAVTGGTKVLSDYLVIRITANPGETFLDRMIALVEGASRQKTPNEIALTILLSGLTIVFLLAVATLQPFAIYAGGAVPVPVLIALLVCLIPTTIGGLLSAIGIAGMDRMIQQNVIAMSGRAVEAAGDVNTLLLDKTGTITLGNRQAAAFLPVDGTTVERLADRAQLSSLADETPEGRSIVVLAKEQFGLRGRSVGAHASDSPSEPEVPGAVFVPFSAATRMSGVDNGTHQVRKGAADAVLRWAKDLGGKVPADLEVVVEKIAREGGTPLVVAERDGTSAPTVLGVVYLKDIVKGGMRERFDRLRAMGIRTVMITGDNPLTAAAIAQEAGVDDFLAEAKPEDKMALIKREQAGAARRDDRRRHQRRAGAGPGRRRRGDEHRHAGGEGSGEHDRPRLQPDEAHRDRGDRQAVADDARIADDVLDRQRRRQVFRHHPGDVRGRLPGTAEAQRHGVGERPEQRRSCRPSSSTPSSSSRWCRWRSGSRRTGHGRRGPPEPQPPDLRPRGASSCPSSGSSSSIDHRLETALPASPERLALEKTWKERKVQPHHGRHNAGRCPDAVARRRLSARGHRPGAGAVSRQGERPADRARREGHRLAYHRPGVLVARIFPSRPSAAGHRLRRGRTRAGRTWGRRTRSWSTRSRRRWTRRRRRTRAAPVPIDLVTSSASGWTRTSRRPRRRFRSRASRGSAACERDRSPAPGRRAYRRAPARLFSASRSSTSSS